MYKQRRPRSSAVVIAGSRDGMTLVCVSPGFAQAKGKGGLKDIGKFVQRRRKPPEAEGPLFVICRGFAGIASPPR